MKILEEKGALRECLFMENRQILRKSRTNQIFFILIELIGFLILLGICSVGGRVNSDKFVLDRDFNSIEILGINGTFRFPLFSGCWCDFTGGDVQR